MRFAVTALTTVVVVVVILLSGSAPTLSGMAVLPPCESAPSSTPSRLKAPTRLRIIGALGLEGLFARGPNAGAEMEYQAPSERAATTSGPHAYYVALASRPDCFAAYSLRDADQVEQYRKRADRSPGVSYLYPDDPDPRRQDAMKIVIAEGSMGLATQLHLPIGPHDPKNLLVVFDFWWGAEFDADYSKLHLHKGTPVTFGSPDDLLWLGLRADYGAARQFPHNQPPGGPYVVIPYAQAIESAAVKAPFYVDGMKGFPRLRLPYDAPAREQRRYVEGIAPVDTSVRPEGMEFGNVAERWTRYWSFFERAPKEDWISDTPGFVGKSMRAYKWTLWGADTEREPVRILNEVIVSVHPDSPGGFMKLRVEFAAGNGLRASRWEGRGPLVAYTRNFVVLHGTPKADVLAMLKKPAL